MSKLDLDRLRDRMKAIAVEGSRTGGFTSRRIVELMNERHADEIEKAAPYLKNIGLMSVLRSARTGKALLPTASNDNLFGDLNLHKGYFVYVDVGNGRQERVYKLTEDLKITEVNAILDAADREKPRERQDLRGLRELQKKAGNSYGTETTVREVLERGP